MRISDSMNAQIQNSMFQNKSNTDNVLEKIAATRELSGKDSANLIIADNLSSQISTLTQQVQNANNSIAMYQVADSSLSSLQDGSNRLNELSVRYNSGILNADQQNMISEEFSATQTAMQDIVDQTSYNGQALLSEQFGLDISGISELSVDNQEGIQSFSEQISSLSTNVGSTMNSLEVNIANSLSAVSNLTAANAQISEQPMSQKINDLNSNELKLNSSIMAQVHNTQMMQQRMAALLV